MRGRPATARPNCRVLASDVPVQQARMQAVAARPGTLAGLRFRLPCVAAMTAPGHFPPDLGADGDPGDDTALLDCAQRHAFGYFEAATDPASGLVADSTQPGSPCSIAGLGMALTAGPVAVERGWTSRARCAAAALRTLRFLAQADMSGTPGASGHRGFYFHFLDMRTGTRAWRSELSSVDTAFLMAGALAAARYFDRADADEAGIRATAALLAERVDWNWMCNTDGAICHGWKPERGFLRYHWAGYNESLLMMVLALGSERHPVPVSTWDAWTAGYRWRRLYGHEHLAAGPLFIHQYPQLWMDLRGVRDAFMRAHDCDYFENSRRATLVQREYAIRNPKGLPGYGADSWGLSACHGPGPRDVVVDGRRRRLLGYAARGAPHGPDDGTLAPSAAVASLPFAPELALRALRHAGGRADDRLDRAFNPGGPDGRGPPAWISPWRFALDNGPLLLMIENHRSGLPWRLMRGDATLRRGLERADFRGGWLEQE